MDKRTRGGEAASAGMPGANAGGIVAEVVEGIRTSAPCGSARYSSLATRAMLTTMSGSVRFTTRTPRA